MHQKIVQNLLTVSNQLKYYHWATNSYARHKALGGAYDDFNELMDEFVEILLGKYGKNLPTINVVIHAKSELEMCAAIEEICNYLSNELPQVLNENDTDLLNIRDEMLAVMNRLKYLFTLK